MYQKEEIKQSVNNLKKWCNENLPKTMDGKFVAYRFEVTNLFIPEKVIVNKKFYGEIISKNQSDLFYLTKLELAKNAHNLFQDAIFKQFEDSIHHPEAVFLVFTKKIEGFELEFKVKKNADGYFLHYMRIL
jgi:hypothetical protein